MREPAADYSADQYERPNQPWVCGLGEHGHACPAGPTARGRCPALAECAPTRDGDRWQCNRSALRGGPCDAGPTPEGGCGCVHKCRPVRSLRSMRGRFVVACALLAVGGVLIALSADWRDDVIKPGRLAQQHAQLLEHADGGAPNCGACHAAASQNVAGWAASLVVTSGDRPTQSQLCMNCHSKSIPKELALAAHNLPAGMLGHMTDARDGEQSTASGNSQNQQKDQDNSSDRFSRKHSRPVTGRRSSVSETRETWGSFLPAQRAGLCFLQSRPDPYLAIACAACHREHHGAEAGLTAIDNAACQACHQQRYDSFAGDHPDFGMWPYERRTQIAFNHAAHRGKHFVEKKQAFDCRTCHVSDATSTVERTMSYETACAACHDEKIATSIGRGVPMLALPTLDVEALKRAGRDVGPWPAEATGEFDGRLPPTMKLLLAADPAAAQAIAKLGAGFEFQDIEPEDAEQLAASADLAAAIKTLFGDMGKRGPAAIRERLSTTLGRDVPDAEVAALTAGLSADTLRGAVDWLPGAANANAALPEAVPMTALAKLAAPYGPAGAWSRDEATLSIRYRPAAHADPVLASWLEALVTTPQLDSRPVALAMFRELSKTTAPGLCASCHSVEQGEAGTLAINWRAYDRTNEPRGFTKFAHGPHLVLPQLADCASCHAIDDAAKATASYSDLNPRHFVSDFKSLTKRQCAECHTKIAAGDSCQSCHNYHVEMVENWRLKSGLRRDGAPISPPGTAAEFRQSFVR